MVWIAAVVVVDVDPATEPRLRDDAEERPAVLEDGNGDEIGSLEQRTDRAGIDLVDEFQACVPELAEKIVDDFFRVYPLRWGGGVAF